MLNFRRAKYYQVHARVILPCCVRVLPFARARLSVHGCVSVSVRVKSHVTTGNRDRVNIALFVGEVKKLSWNMERGRRNVPCPNEETSSVG